jgi:hypothetical protein
MDAVLGIPLAGNRFLYIGPYVANARTGGTNLYDGCLMQHDGVPTEPTRLTLADACREAPGRRDEILSHAANIVHHTGAPNLRRQLQAMGITATVAGRTLETSGTSWPDVVGGGAEARRRTTGSTVETFREPWKGTAPGGQDRGVGG